MAEPDPRYALLFAEGIRGQSSHRNDGGSQPRFVLAQCVTDQRAH